MARRPGLLTLDVIQNWRDYDWQMAESRQTADNLARAPGDRISDELGRSIWWSAASGRAWKAPHRTPRRWPASTK